MVIDELTYKVIGCAMKVHQYLGNGFQEVIYQRCLAIELEISEVPFAPGIGTDHLLPRKTCWIKKS